MDEALFLSKIDELIDAVGQWNCALEHLEPINERLVTITETASAIHTEILHLPQEIAEALGD